MKDNQELDQFYHSIQNYKALNKEENHALFLKYSQNHSEEIRDQIVEGNLRLVIKAVSKFEFNDVNSLIQEGTIGLVKAVEKYDINKSNIAFSTFAWTYIEGSIKDFIKKNEKSLNHISLDYESIENENSLSVTLSDYKDPSVIYEEKRFQELFEASFASLTSKEREILQRKFPIDGRKVTFTEIAHDLHVSIPAVTKLYKSAINKISSIIKKNQ